MTAISMWSDNAHLITAISLTGRNYNVISDVRVAEQTAGVRGQISFAARSRCRRENQTGNKSVHEARGVVDIGFKLNGGRLQRRGTGGPAARDRGQMITDHVCSHL